MAQLPPDGSWLMQEIGGTVILFRRYTEEEIIRLDPGSPASVETAFTVIAASDRLTDEQKCFAYFWAGYFGGHALYPPPPEGSRVSYDKGVHQVIVLLGGVPPMLHTYDAGDGNMAAQAQAVIAFSATIPDADKPMAHFWCGYFWATVGGEGRAVATPDVAPAPEPASRPYYADLGVTDDEVARGDDYGRYDFPNLRKDEG